MDKVKFLTLEDLTNEQDLYGQCMKCFKFHTWPSTWTVGNKKEEDNSSSSDSSCGFLADDSVDTDSDREQVTLE